jgi:hypothetical protein
MPIYARHFEPGQLRFITTSPEIMKELKQRCAPQPLNRQS